LPEVRWPSDISKLTPTQKEIVEQGARVSGRDDHFFEVRFSTRPWSILVSRIGYEAQPLVKAIPNMILAFHHGVRSISSIASKAGMSPRTLRAALRKAEKTTDGPLRDLYLAELGSRDKRP